MVERRETPRRKPKVARIRNRQEALLRQFAQELATHNGPAPLEEVRELGDEFVKVGMRELDRLSLKVIKTDSS
jgi:hypothetical protein